MFEDEPDDAVTIKDTGDTDSEKSHGLINRILNYDAVMPLAPSTFDAPKTSKKLSTLNGVFFPCCQNILGVLLFLRLNWVLGECGLVASFQIFFVSCSVAIITSLSMAALATNGHVPAGGAYYMIKKSVGPECAGAVGILFYIGMTLGAAMITTGAIEILMLYLVGEEMEIFSDQTHNFRLYGTALLIVMIIVVGVGVRIVTKLGIIIIPVVSLAIASIIIGAFTKFYGNEDFLICVVGKRLVNAKYLSNCTKEGLSSIICPSDGAESCDHFFKLNSHLVTKLQAFPGISSGVFFENIYNIFYEEGDFIASSYSIGDYSNADKENSADFWVLSTQSTDFMVALAIFFPALTGIMAGSNRSGDLRNPQKSIPLGTISAVVASSVIYFTMAILDTATADRRVLLDKYGHGLAEGGRTLNAYLSWPPRGSATLPSFTEVGALLAATGSAMQTLTGSPRLLQAIANDFVNIRPLDKIAQLKNGEPRVALIITFFVCEIGILIGELDKIAPLMTMFYLMFYAAVNVSCIIMDFSGNPEWRPTFRFYHWSIAVVGVILCVGIMVSTYWMLAGLAFVIFVGTFLILSYFGRTMESGSGIRGLRFQWAWKNILKLSTFWDASIHQWRPQILFLVDLTKQSDSEELENNDSTKIDIEKKNEYWGVDQDGSRAFRLGHFLLNHGEFLAIAGCTICEKNEDATNPRLLSVPYSRRNKLILQEMIQNSMRKQKVIGIAKVEFSKTDSLEHLSSKYSSLIRSTGLGSLSPNTVMIPFPGPTSEMKDVLFKHVVLEAMLNKMAIISPMGDMTLWDGDEISQYKIGFINIVVLDIKDCAVLLIIAHLLASHPKFERCKLRVLNPIYQNETEESVEDMKKWWLDHLHGVRIRAKVYFFRCDLSNASINGKLRQYWTKRTVLTLMSLKYDLTGQWADEMNLQAIDRWMNECRERGKSLDNVIAIWHGMVAYEMPSGRKKQENPLKLFR